jgi:redox-sensitive bicupin YhaK (pirin superfamily)
MISLRRSDRRGATKLGWLDSRHSFSFGDYSDAEQMGFRDLRVINEDRVDPAAGFPTHSHRDMEIITYVLEGALAHTDSTGTSSIIRAGDVQRMSAGTGISHSEYNPSPTEPVHFLQIWILPDAKGLKPGYEQRSFELDRSEGMWVLVAARDARDGAVKIHQDVDLSLAFLPKHRKINYPLKSGRHAWMQTTRGSVRLNGEVLNAGDGAAVSREETLEVRAAGAGPAEVLLFDLA